MAGKVRLFSICAVQLELREKKPPELAITVHGYAVSSGWTNPALVPLEKKLSADGILDLDFVATPPDAISLPMLTPETAELVWTDLDGLIGVRVVSRSGDVIQFLPPIAAAQPTTQIAGEGPHPAMAQMAAPGGATTMATGEEGPPPITTMATGEEAGGGGTMMTTLAVGEESPGHMTTLAMGEEAGGGGTVFTTLMLGEEGGGYPPTTHMLGEEHGGYPPTTHMLGEEHGGYPPTTLMLGEEGGGLPPRPEGFAAAAQAATTLVVGEEGGGQTTHLLGEEGGGLPPTTHMLGEEHGGYPPITPIVGEETTHLLGEHGGGLPPTTHLLGEEHGGYPPATTAPLIEETTQVVGEGPHPTTLVVGEEGPPHTTAPLIEETTQIAGEGWIDPQDMNPLGRR
ncbi:MAG TPA: hypothetical protein VK614_10890 [Allosphingosinicella sp.]|nr:hypothetical protein [Allosphingosinicella sp.]